jgi:glycosyltransferase involved in cell wall biosynthesis
MLSIAQVAAADISIEVLLADHIRALEAAGHEVTAICGPGERVERIRASGIRLEVVEMARELSPAADLRCLHQLRALFRQRRFDVVHTHTPKAGLLGPLAARWAGVPVVVHTIHGLLFHDRMPRWRQAAFWMPEKVTASFTHQLLSQSREDIDIARRSGLCAPQQIHYLGNGIDVRRFAPCPDLRGKTRRDLGWTGDEFVIGGAGRLVYEKGFAELFAAAQALIAQDRRMRLLVIGPADPGQKDAIPESVLAPLRATGAVQFLAWQEDMRPWYTAMDVFVLPSYREGIPRACMEAAATGVPVIASDIRGCREVVLPGRTGLLVRPRDVQGFTAAIRQLARDPAQRTQMGAAGQRHMVENFDLRLVLDRLLSFYDTIEAGLGRRAAHA